jgi:hypothetical protein
VRGRVAAGRVWAGGRAATGMDGGEGNVWVVRGHGTHRPVGALTSS